ncbi:hypothetical protein HK096_010477 [Nowakowskiella sp. JEL0078]|nr:hypothetical protein HK096_010477 [Nowakowskiella sp. JEL0078]
MEIPGPTNIPILKEKQSNIEAKIQALLNAKLPTNIRKLTNKQIPFTTDDYSILENTNSDTNGQNTNEGISHEKQLDNQMMMTKVIEEEIAISNSDEEA